MGSPLSSGCSPGGSVGYPAGYAEDGARAAWVGIDIKRWAGEID